MNTEDLKKNKIDWLTPPSDAERIVVPILGGMPDVDPCGHPDSAIQAKRSFCGMGDDATDGFAASWSSHGKTAYVCPTFGDKPPKPEVCFHPVPHFQRMTDWIAKCHLEGQSMTVLALLPNYVDRGWFHTYVANSTAFCLLEKRRKFHLPKDPVEGGQGTFEMYQPQYGQMYALWTPDTTVVERFYDALADDGMIIEPG